MSYDPEANSPLEDLMEFGFAEGRIYNKALQSDNILKTTVTLTPDSEPALISQTTEALEDRGFNFRLTDDGKNFEIAQISPTDDILNPYTVVAVTLGFFVGVAYLNYKIIDELSDAIELGTYDFSEAEITETFTKISITPAGPIQRDVISIDYGNAELDDILGRTLPFPGQTESQRIVEIFRPEAVDGTEDFTILPVESGIIIPRTTEFPQGDAILEDLLNGGIFTGGGDELPEGAYVLASNGNGGLTAYNPEEISNLENNSWRSVFIDEQTGKVQGTLRAIDGNLLPDRNTLPIRRDADGKIIPQRTHGVFKTGNNNIGTKFVSGESLRSQQARRELLIRNIGSVQPYEGENLTATTIRFRLNKSFSHAEGHAAYVIRTFNLESGKIIINNDAGPCENCLTAIPRILPDGAVLEVVHQNTSGQLVTDIFIGGQLFNLDTDRTIK